MTRRSQAQVEPSHSTNPQPSRADDIKGKVVFIGTGPGDPSLLTFKAKKNIEQADVILYESTIHPNLLYFCKEGAKCLLIQKNKATFRKFIISQAKAGNTVAILIHGDVVLHSKCPEEIQFLSKNQIPYEMVPGISETAIPILSGATAPMSGIKVIVLRSIDQSQDLTDDLSELGADVIQCPMIKIVPTKKELQKVNASFLSSFNTLIFTSANGVRFFMNALFEKLMDARVLSNKKIIAIGPKTKESLMDCGIIADAMPHKFVAESILDVLDEDIKNEKILIPTAFGARQVLPDELRKRGAEVCVLKIYKNVTPPIPKSISVKDGDLVIFTSSSTADHFFNSPLYKKQKIVPFCIGEITRKTVLKYLGNQKIYTSKESTAQSLVDCIHEYVDKSLNKKKALCSNEIYKK